MELHRQHQPPPRTAWMMLGYLAASRSSPALRMAPLSRHWPGDVVLQHYWMVARAAEQDTGLPPKVGNPATRGCQ